MLFSLTLKYLSAVGSFDCILHSSHLFVHSLHYFNLFFIIQEELLNISSNSVIQVLFSLFFIGFTAFFKKTVNLTFKNPFLFSDYFPRCTVLSYECNMKYEWEIRRYSFLLNISQTEILDLLQVQLVFHFYMYLIEVICFMMYLELQLSLSNF